MKLIATVSGYGIIACCVVFGLAGCGGEVDDVPQTAAERIKAIDNNPDFKPEQKEAYKKQVQENERMEAMLQKRSQEMPQQQTQPLPSR